MSTKFDKTYCSQCGREFGPGDAGFSHCSEHLKAAAPDLLAALTELHAMVKGECPSLLNEDSGGSARLAMQIEDAIAKATGASNV